jgi:hypothetical protein
MSSPIIGLSIPNHSLQMWHYLGDAAQM